MPKQKKEMTIFNSSFSFICFMKILAKAPGYITSREMSTNLWWVTLQLDNN